MKPHGSIRVVRRWCGEHTDPIHGCFDNSEGLNNRHLPSWRNPRVCELTNDLRLGTAVSKSGSKWSLSHHARVRASKGKYISIGPDRG
jgi:hypothetical protein